MGHKGKKPCCPTCGQPIHETHAKALKAEDTPPYVPVQGSVKKTSGGAVLFACANLSGVAMEVWVPKSQINQTSFEVGVPVTLSIKPWFVKKEGIRFDN